MHTYKGARTCGKIAIGKFWDSLYEKCPYGTYHNELRLESLLFICTRDFPFNFNSASGMTLNPRLILHGITHGRYDPTYLTVSVVSPSCTQTRPGALDAICAKTMSFPLFSLQLLCQVPPWSCSASNFLFIPTLQSRFWNQFKISGLSL